MAADKSWWTAFVDYVLFLINNAVYSGIPLFFWVRPRWSAQEIPSQAGKIVLITGANSGVGLESARALYVAGAKVYMACRSEEKARNAIERIKASAASDKVDKLGELVFLQLDLTDLHSVVSAAESFLRQETRLDVLMANAGIMATAEGQHTKQGYTLQTGTNVLGHQALISRLLPTLLSTSRQTPNDSARVILLSSAGHAMAPKHGIDYNSLIADPAVLAAIKAGDSGLRTESKRGRGKNELDRMTEYAQSKWADLAMSKYMESVYGPHGDKGMEGRKVGEGELINFSVHPGLADHISAFHFIRKYLLWAFALIVRHTDAGASNQLWAATMPAAQARELSGSYIVPFQRIGRARPDALVRANQVRLWDWCEAEVKKHV